MHLVALYYKNILFVLLKSDISLASNILKCILDCSYSYNDEQNFECFDGLYTFVFRWLIYICDNGSLGKVSLCAELYRRLYIS